MLQANTREMEKRTKELATFAGQLYRIEEELEELLQGIRQQGGEMLLPALKKICENLCREKRQMEELESRLYEIGKNLESCEARITEEYFQERLPHKHTPSATIQILPESIRNGLTTTIGINF